MKRPGPGTWHAPRKVPKRGMVCEMMAGTRRVATAAANAGWWACSFEIEGHPDEDVLSKEVNDWFDEVAAAGLIALLWIGLVCSSWSRARRNTSGKRGFPPPLRDSADHILGLPNLSEKDQLRVIEGNRQMRWAARRFSRAARDGYACVIENPASSRLWESPPFRHLLKKFPCVEVHYCAFGTEWRKATKLIYVNIDFGSLMKYKCHGRGECDFTGNKHLQLSGKDPVSGKMWSSVASAYPPRLCAEVVRCLPAG